MVVSFSSRRVRFLVTMLAAVALGAPAGHAQSSSLPVFPQAQGYGTLTRAAYGTTAQPTVYRVTNLNDSGAGSLRAALTATGPRVVIFEISGTISLSSKINITDANSYLTVAGQTAPSPGITVRGDYIQISNAHDILIQHIRVRAGDQGGSSPLSERRGVSVDSGSYNVVIDHCSYSWHSDEGISAFSRTTHDVTFSNNIISEGLFDTFDTAGKGGGHGPAGLANVAILRNLYAHNADRNPYLTQGTTTIVVNNVMYNWSAGGATYFNGAAGNGPLSPVFSAVVGNRYIRGPNTPAHGTIGIVFYGDWLAGACCNGLIMSGSKIYKADNTVSGDGMREYHSYATFNPLVSAPPSELNGILNRITVLAGSAAEAYVLANVGARPADRDSHDTRIVTEVANRTGSIKRRGAYGGWPTLAVNVRPLTLPSNPHSVSASGYTNLEVWLHAFAAAVEGRATSSQVPVVPTGVRIVSGS